MFDYRPPGGGRLYDMKVLVHAEQNRMRDEGEKERSERQADREREFQLQFEKERSDTARAEHQYLLELEEKKELYAISRQWREKGRKNNIASGTMECRPGYFGIGCDSPCPKGLFGERCAGKCLPRCSEDECDRIHGCPYVTNVQKMTTTVEDISQFVNSSNVHQTTEKSMAGVSLSGFNIIHLLAGLGTIICLFLFVIIIQLIKRSRNSGSKIVIQESCIKMNTHSEKFVRSQEKESKAYNMIPEPIKSQTRRPYDTEYEEIHEGIEMCVQNYPNTSLGYEQPQRILPRNSSDKPDVNRSSFPINDVLVRQNENESVSEMESSDMYLKPVFAEI